MSMNFSGAGPEKEYSGGGPIPEDSMVKARVSIQAPKPEYACQSDPMLFQARTGLLGLNVVYEVVSGKFAGRKIYDDTTWIPPEMQQVQLKQGQHGVCEGGSARILAILNAARGINENSVVTPQVREAQSVHGWQDFNGLEVGVVVGIKEIKPGDRYINNNVKAVITMGGKYNDSYQAIMAGGEYITDKPVPELPTADNQNPTPQWGNTQPAQAAQQPANQAQQGMPQWGQTTQQPTQQPQGQTYTPPQNNQGQQQFAPPPQMGQPAPQGAFPNQSGDSVLF